MLENKHTKLLKHNIFVSTQNLDLSVRYNRIRIVVDNFINSSKEKF